MRDRYENPLTTRYADQQMSYLFSDDMRYRTWRRLWIALAEAEHEMGLPVSAEQVAELRAHSQDIDYEAAERYERQLRHDVMAHVRAYADQCPTAAPIIHLGATSCFVTDNADLIVMDRALELIEDKVANVIAAVSTFAERHMDTPALGYTHLQAAQPTTLGKRATLWIQDLMLDMSRLHDIRSNYMLRGLKGTTGTQASFMELFDGDWEKVEELERRVMNKVGYLNAFPVTGQTYPRKFDSMILDVLSGLCQSASKYATDIRLLQSREEVEEPFELGQVGSSAMAYKRNPIHCERICGIARFVMSLSTSADMTAATQWLERTLDDSAARRLTLPQAFLGTAAVLNLYHSTASGLVVYDKVLERHLRDELPFLMTESILMHAVQKGGSRQELHEKLRQYSMQARYRVRVLGEDNTLLDVIADDPDFRLDREELEALADPARHTGAAARQTAAFLEKQARPLLNDYADALTAVTNIEF